MAFYLKSDATVASVLLHQFLELLTKLLYRFYKAIYCTYIAIATIRSALRCTLNALLLLYIISIATVAIFAVTLLLGVLGKPIERNDEKALEVVSLAKESRNSCVYSSHYLTINLKKIANRFK